MKAETPEQQIERILNLRLNIDTHKEMYEKFGHEIWDLAKVCELWYDEDISNSRMRELIGIYLWNSRQELLKEIIAEIEKTIKISLGNIPESGYYSGLKRAQMIIKSKLKEDK